MMPAKTKIKLVIDVLMTLCLLFVTGYQFWGEVAHEWVGAGMFVLFIAHHILNRKWYRNLFRGKYSAARIFMLCIDILVFAAMIMEMYSGIVLSRHVFAFLPIESGLALARKLHILGAYWGFLLMSLHLGLHWGMILGMLKKALKIKPSPNGKLACFLAGALIAAYGVFVIFSRNYPTYLFLQSEFVFLDYDEPPILFYLDHLALMGSCIFVSHYLMQLTRKRNEKKSASDENSV